MFLLSHVPGLNWDMDTESPQGECHVCIGALPLSVKPGFLFSSFLPWQRFLSTTPPPHVMFAALCVFPAMMLSLRYGVISHPSCAVCVLCCALCAVRCVLYVVLCGACLMFRCCSLLLLFLLQPHPHLVFRSRAPSPQKRNLRSKCSERTSSKGTCYHSGMKRTWWN